MAEIPSAQPEDGKIFDAGFVHRRMKPWEYGGATSSWWAQPQLRLVAPSRGRSHNQEGICTA
jgi:hypothetical protein